MCTNLVISSLSDLTRHRFLDDVGHFIERKAFEHVLDNGVVHHLVVEQCRRREKESRGKGAGFLGGYFFESAGFALVDKPRAF
eukprot:2304395-Pyramimonas_sp.AAC.1